MLVDVCNYAFKSFWTLLRLTPNPRRVRVERHHRRRASRLHRWPRGWLRRSDTSYHLICMIWFDDGCHPAVWFVVRHCAPWILSVELLSSSPWFLLSRLFVGLAMLLDLNCPELDCLNFSLSTLCLDLHEGFKQLAKAILSLGTAQAADQEERFFYDTSAKCQTHGSASESELEHDIVNNHSKWFECFSKSNAMQFFYLFVKG